ncbi:MAG TPA: hypothetical protein DCL29_05400 [Eubacterium sp.]|nr:hypothetical protein [Eubacterium sp.]
MRIILEIPDSDIPKKQEIITVPIHFIDGTVCEAGGFGFDVIPKGHGRLMILSEDRLKENQMNLDFSFQKWIDEVGLSNATVAIINADKED